MNRISAALLILFLSYACSPNKDELVIPYYVIPQDSMIHILVDVQMVEGALIYKRSMGMIYNDFRDYYYDFVFDKYHIDQERFDKSMNFYKENLNVLDKIYEQVLQKLEAKKREADNS